MVSDWPFRQKTALLFIISAFLLPFILLTPDIISAGAFMLCFVIAQSWLLFWFYKEESGFEAWHTFIAAMAGLVFMLVIAIRGRGLFMECLGFLLFLGYIVSALIFWLLGKPFSFARKKSSQQKPGNGITGSEITDDDIESFRRKDDLDNLVRDFQIQPPPKKESDGLDDIGEIFSKPKASPPEYELEESRPEPENEKPFFEYGNEDDKDYDKGDDKQESGKEGAPDEEAEVIEDDEDSEDYFVNMLKKQEERKREPDRAPNDRAPRFSDYFNKEHSYSGDRPMTGDIKSASSTPLSSSRIDFDNVKSDLEKIDSGVKTISEKIKEISENAIKEGEERKKKALEEKKRAEKNTVKKPEPDRRVFASNNGTKYHNDRNCVTLKRVSKKNTVSFIDSNEARKRGLKACGLCKR